MVNSERSWRRPSPVVSVCFISSYRTCATALRQGSQGKSCCWKSQASHCYFKTRSLDYDSAADEDALLLCDPMLFAAVDAGDNRIAVPGDGAAAGRAGAVQRSDGTLLQVVLRSARRHNGYSCTNQQRRQLRAVLHDECPVQADVRPPHLAVAAAARLRHTAPPAPTPGRRHRWPCCRHSGRRGRKCRQTAVWRLWRRGNVAKHYSLSWLRITRTTGN